jgi:hypothetical protein
MSNRASNWPTLPINMQFAREPALEYVDLFLVWSCVGDCRCRVAIALRHAGSLSVDAPAVLMKHENLGRIPRPHEAVAQSVEQRTFNP